MSIKHIPLLKFDTVVPIIEVMGLNSGLTYSDCINERVHCMQSCKFTKRQCLTVLTQLLAMLINCKQA